MRFGSVCSGIEAASVAWNPLGWEAAWLSEIEQAPSAVLAHHYPDVANLGDMNGIAELIRSGEIEAPEVFTGGTPCQAFSLAGKRESLSDDRGNLSLTFCEIANAIDDIRRDRSEQPGIIIWENVPGVLSTNDNAFGHFLAGLAGDDLPLEPGPRPEPGRSSAHWTWKKDTGQHCAKWPDAGAAVGPRRAVAWRVLDAQYFGLAQRRKRVFVVASARKGFDPAKVLFEFEGVRRDSPPSREAEPAVAALTARGVGTCGADENQAQAGHLRPVWPAGFRMTAFGEYSADGSASTMKARDYKDATDLVVHGTQDPIVSRGRAHALGRNNGQENVVLQGVIQNATRGASQNGLGVASPSSPMYTLDCASQHGVAYRGRVRRLMPIECERLQGFPDDYTLVPFNGKPMPDTHRYKALGNSWAVPCVRWIGERVISTLRKSEQLT